MPLSSRATISPSRMACCPEILSPMLASSGYCELKSFWLRETKRARPLLRKQTARMPSHFVSKSHSGSENGLSTSVANIGRIICGIAVSFALLQGDFVFDRAIGRWLLCVFAPLRLCVNSEPSRKGIKNRVVQISAANYLLDSAHRS